MRPRHDGISCPLQVECQQEPGDERQLSLTLQQQTVASDTEVSPAAASEESGLTEDVRSRTSSSGRCY